MEIVQRSPFEVRTIVWEAKPSQWSLTICVKATYRLVHGGEAELAESVPPTALDERWDEVPDASLRTAADLVPYKPKADLLLFGHAYAPGGKEATSLVVRWRVGEFEKAVRVTGDRLWTPGDAGLVVGPPVAFAKMPLRYERAALSDHNPVGLDVTASPVAAAPARPNLEPAEGARTAGFGPLARDWPARRKLLTDDQLAWARSVEGRASEGPAPEGFDFAFFNAAPSEQQVDILRANSAIVLENLHPTQPLLATRLPAQRPKAHRIDANGRFHEIPLRCDTLAIDADALIATLCFRGLADLGEAPDDAGHVVVDLESARGIDLRAGGIPPGTAPHPLAIRHDSIRSAREEGEDGDGQTQRIVRRFPEGSPMSRTHELPPGQQATRALPFAGKRLPPPPPPREMLADAPDTTEDEMTPKRRQPALPFGTEPAGPLPEKGPAAGVAALQASGETMEIDVDKVEQAILTALPFLEGRSAAAVEAMDDAGTDAPTPEIGTVLSIGRCARIAAEIRYGPGKDDVLREESLPETTWKAALSHWQRALRDEAARGESSLNDKFDRIYVGLFEELTRRVEPDDYAELVVATERAVGVEAAARLGLDAGDLPRALRALHARFAAEPDDLARAREAIDKRRRDP